MRVWEVIKAREALEAYAKGDSVEVPNVLRLPNEVDAKPVQLRLKY